MKPSYETIAALLKGVPIHITEASMVLQKDPYDDRKCRDRDLTKAPRTPHTGDRGGPADCIFAALHEAFVQAAATGHVVMG